MGGFRLPTKIIFLSLLVSFLTTGCAQHSNNLEMIAREQAATIDSLNHEIQRLNEELDQVILSREELHQAKKALEEKLQSELASGDMSVALNQRGLVVTMLDRILFDSGRAELRESARGSLNKIADVLRDKLQQHSLYVEGHTDNVPIRYSSWRSNWELSTARATEVIHYFIEQHGIDPERLAAVGYGEFRPVTPNTSDQGRMENRRVEIVISPAKLLAPA